MSHGSEMLLVESTGPWKWSDEICHPALFRRGDSDRPDVCRLSVRRPEKGVCFASPFSRHVGGASLVFLWGESSAWPPQNFFGSWGPDLFTRIPSPGLGGEHLAAFQVNEGFLQASPGESGTSLASSHSLFGQCFRGLAWNCGVILAMTFLCEVFFFCT